MAKIRDTVSAVALIAAGHDDEYVETVVQDCVNLGKWAVSRDFEDVRRPDGVLSD